MAGRSRFGIAAGLLVAAVFARGTGAAQQQGELDVIPVRSNVYMIAGAGANIAAQIGPAGVILVDSGAAGTSDRVLAAVRRLTDLPIRYIINTTSDADHAGGNEALSKAGRTILGAPGSSGFNEAVFTNGGIAGVLAHENVLAFMRRQGEPVFPFAVWPTKTYSGRQYSMYLNADGIQVVHMPAAHTDGDSIVFFRRADVIVAGDVVDLTRFPMIDIARGGSIQGAIDALNRLLELTVPPFPLRWQEDRTLIVPGHGFVADYADLADYRNVVTIMRDRIQDMVGRGMTLEQVKASDPAKGFKGRYGADAGPWTTDMFIEAVYTSLAPRR
jgi:glyoxylase-like metal-dependent hydrolase (beta-lactamase superfamily II)